MPAVHTPAPPRGAASILELAARSMFTLFAGASEGILLVDRDFGASVLVPPRTTCRWERRAARGRFSPRPPWASARTPCTRGWRSARPALSR